MFQNRTTEAKLEHNDGSFFVATAQQPWIHKHTGDRMSKRQWTQEFRADFWPDILDHMIWSL